MSIRKASWFALVWAIVVAAMFGQLIAYSAEPGQVAQPPMDWPGLGKYEQPSGRWKLAVFVHPKCPCTRATLSEFAHLYHDHHDKINATLVVYRPADQSPGWANGPLIDAASRIAGLKLTDDPGGDVARRFGAMTSGHVLAYAPDGKLIYTGGLTNSRGHEGLSDGTAHLSQALAGKQVNEPISFPVFGCPIFESKEGCDESGCGTP